MKTDSLQWDAVLMEHAETLGTGLIYLVVAHEFGHVVQARKNLNDSAPEFVAGCLTIYGAAADGIVTLKATAEQEIVNSLSSLADQAP